MAQTPDIKTPTPGQEKLARKVEDTAKQTVAAESLVSQGMQSVGHHGAAAMNEAGGDLSASMRRCGEEVTRMACHTNYGMTSRLAEGLADWQRSLMEDMAERFEILGRHIAVAVQDNVSDKRSFIVPPLGATESLGDLQAGVSGLVSSVVHSNVRMAQELLRMTDPGAVIDLQRRFMRDYMDALLEGTVAIVRATRRSADQTLQPIDARLEQRYTERAAAE